MATIKVRTRPDRLAFTAPTNGKPIPSDRFVSVQLTPWISRLIEVHGDLEVEPVVTAAPAAVKRSAKAD